MQTNSRDLHPWVETTASESNEHLVRTYLLKDKAVKARFIGMKTAAATAEAGEKACSQRLREVPLPFDVLILGMGSDGHTASLFPGARQFPAAVDANSGRICMGINPPSAPHERMTLTCSCTSDWMGCSKIPYYDMVAIGLQVYLRF